MQQKIHVQVQILTHGFFDGGGETLLAFVNEDAVDCRFLRKFGNDFAKLQWLPVCKLMNTPTFSDVWLVGKNELKRVYGK